MTLSARLARLGRYFSEFVMGLLNLGSFLGSLGVGIGLLRLHLGYRKLVILAKIILTKLIH